MKTICVFKDELFGKHWTGTGTSQDPLVFKKTLYDLWSITIKSANVGSVIISYADGIDETIEIAAGVEKEILLSSNFDQMFFTLKLVGSLEYIKFYKKIDVTDYINGTGENDIKQVDIEGSGILHYPVVKPGYFYIDNEEYYSFADMEQVELEPSGIVPSGYTTSEYVVGEPYFIVPSGFISPSGHVKTPVEDYTVEWAEASGIWAPTSSGYLSDESLYLTFEKGTQKTLTKKVPLENKYLVLKKVINDPSTLEVKPMWLPYIQGNNIFRSYVLVEDESGQRMKDVTVTWYEIKENDAIVEVESINGNNGKTITNEDGVAYLDFKIEGSASGSHIFVTSGIAASPSIWIQTPEAPTTLWAGVFQLDTKVIWDSQQAKTAMGVNCWSDEWGIPASGAISTEIEDYAAWDAPGTRAAWETANPNFRRPPITSSGLISEETGRWNGNDYITEHSVPNPSGVIDVMENMRVSIEGYWGQYLVSGLAIRTTYKNAVCLNHANDYPITQTDNADGYSVFGATGSWDDIVAFGDAEPAEIYDNLLYVIFCPRLEAPPSGWPEDEPLDITNFDPALDFYFRGIAIYSVEETNLLEYHEQDRTIKQISSYAELQ